MADQALLAGACFVTIGGQSYHIAGEGSYQVSGQSREVLNGQDGYHGYSGVDRPGKMSWKGRDSGAVSISALNDLSNETVVFHLANGKTVVGRNMSRIGEPITVNTEDGTFDMEFMGPDVSDS